MSIILLKNTSRHLVNVKLGHHDKKSVIRQNMFIYIGLFNNMKIKR